MKRSKRSKSLYPEWHRCWYPESDERFLRASGEQLKSGIVQSLEKMSGRAGRVHDQLVDEANAGD
eukprot:2486687-Karenia_brevis.AAC.1